MRVDLFVKNGAGVKLAYSISYIYGLIATESCRKVHLFISMSWLFIVWNAQKPLNIVRVLMIADR